MNDYISRQAVLDRFEEAKSKAKNEKDKMYLVGVVATICAFPSADVRLVVRGEWVKRVNPLGAGDVLTRCNRCGRTSDVATPFCPWCGADMRGEAR